jgi:hypothetical protein
MGGGLMQLVAYGAQDIYLTGNPQITFFKVVYRRHTNFSMEAIEQTWNGTSAASDGRCTATISRNGDLVHRMYLELTTGDTVLAEGGNFGASCITDVELEIGGQKIDKQSGLWMETWAELTEPNPTGACGKAKTGKVIGGTLFQKMSLMGGVIDGASSGTDMDKLFVPLQFWFCKNPGLALPLIALQYHEVKVVLNHTIASTLAATGHKQDNKLWCDYIYLDTDERRRFAQVSHEYLIEQVQEQSLTDGTGDLNFNHPVKELVWCASAKVSGTVAPTSIAIGTETQTYLLKLNGHDRFSARDWRYFSRTQVWQHHSGAGGLTSVTSDGDLGLDGQFDDSIGVYSFALKPEEHQPSGTCNFSRIDNARLEASAPRSGINKIFAVNYNVLRIMSGMGGLAYSN